MRRNRVEYGYDGPLRQLLDDARDRCVRRGAVVDDVSGTSGAAIVFVVGGGCGDDGVEATELRELECWTSIF